MSALLEDVLRHKTVSKVEDENFIFIRRALDVKTKASFDKKADMRARLGSDVELYVDDPMTNVDFEDRYKSEKRLKHAVRKLINLNTTRMLDVLGYSTTEKDVRRLDYAIKSFGSENALLQRKLTQLSFGAQESQLAQDPVFGGETGKALQDRISQLGTGIPRLDLDLQTMQQEISALVENYTQATKAAQGAQYREMQASNTIKALQDDLNQLRNPRQVKPDNTLASFIKNDYFYKELNGKPSVTFFDEGSSPDKS